MRYLLTYFFFLSLGFAYAQEGVNKTPNKVSKSTTSIKENDINLIEIDSTSIDTIKKPSFLKGDVKYRAKNYMRLNRKSSKMYLYDDAKIDYTDLNIESGNIIINQQKKEVYAKGITDTADVYTQTPIFTQASNVVEPDTIRFNFESKKALIYNSKTTQNEFNIISEVSKRENDSVVYMKNVKFTTSKNLEDPEYYFYARRIKFIPKKKIVTGLVNMYIADVPTPLGLPFGYFPLKQEAVSGFIIPSFNESRNRGFTFQNGGYYFAINDYVDLTLVGDYSTNSSFALRAETSYAKRYKYGGNLNLRFENNLNSERGLPDFSKSSNYNIQWSHRQDTKATPNSRFGASVNFGSTQFFRQSNNQTNFGSQLTNILSSSINYSKVFPVEPQVDISTAVNITQNSNNELVNVTTPTSLNIGRIYPFAPKSGVKKGIIQNINFQPSSTITNQITVGEDDLFTKAALDSAQVGIRHRIPISTNFKVLKFISATLSSSYNENWVFETTRLRFDPNDDRADNQGVVTESENGFDSFRTYNFGASLGTTVYGTVKFNKDAKIKAIRHVMRPQVSYNYGPSFDQFFDEIVIPANTALQQQQTTRQFTRFQGGVLGAPGRNESSSMSFSVVNNFEAKVKDKDTTNLEPKRIKLLNALTFRSGFNFRADSLKLSPISVSGNIPFTKKLNINFNGVLNPYALNSNNNPINTLNINNGGSLFRLTNAGINFGYSFSSKDFENRKKNKEEDEDLLDPSNQTFRNGGRPDDLFGTHSNIQNGKLFDDETQEEKNKKTDVDFYNYKIPWDLQIQYRLNYLNIARQNEISGQTINVSGNVEIAPRWKVGASTGYDLVNKGITFTNLRFQRDLESWNMSFNWVPFGINPTWNFFIGISSSVLSDIKWDKRSEPDRRL